MLGAAGLAGAGAASLALVGCGDDDNGGKSSLSLLATATPNAATVAVKDPFAGATPGGTFRWVATGDPSSIDPYGNVSFTTKTISAYVYSRLFKYKTGTDIARSDVRPTGDLATSYETSPDQLKWTIKLRPGVKFHNVAPVNGRAVTVDDVKFSWGRITEPKQAAGAQVAFVDKVEYPDASTIVFTLKAPNPVFLDVIADSNLFWVMPTEADGKFDPAKTMIGSGPWIFDSYTPSVNYKMKKNPDWYEKGFPLMDAVEVPIITEYATRLAQFLAGNLDFAGINPTDLTDVQKTPNVKFGSYKNAGLNWLFFDGNDPNAPYIKDERIRLALSMACNRDELTDLAYNTKKLNAAGIKASYDWNNLIPAGYGRFWLDPKSPKAGDTAKYFKYDPAEAKKLLSAAGYTDSNPFSVTYQYPANIYGKDFNDSAEATLGYINALGNAKMNVEVQDYSSKYITQTFLGNFKGVAFGLETGFVDPGNYAIRLFTPNGNNHGKTSDPVLAKFADAQRLEVDDAKRVQLFQDAQLYHASKMWYIPLQRGAGETWLGIQGPIQNGEAFYSPAYGYPTEQFAYVWRKKA